MGLGKKIKCRRCVFLLQLRRPKGAVIDGHAEHSAQTDCERTRKGTGGGGGGWPAYEEQKRFIGGRGPHLADIVRCYKLLYLF